MLDDAMDKVDKVNRYPLWIMAVSVIGICSAYWGYVSFRDGATTSDIKGIEKEIAGIKTEVSGQPRQSSPTTANPTLQKSTAHFEQKLRDLQTAAEEWRRRRSDQTPNVLAALQAITDEDRARFSPRDQAAWNTLKNAEALLDWTKKGFTEETARLVPMGMDRDNTQDLSDRAAGILTSQLRDEGFHVTDKDFAIVLSVTNASQDETLIPQTGTKRAEWTVKTKLHIKAAWIGEAPSLYDGYVEGIGQGDKDVARIESVESASREALSRLKGTIQ